ncbi:MAG: Gfo/Idh/MocA family oxidoreductase [Synechococcales cyanobacterium RM1_1_8]|nr:Gfo/Idh/MocA family oxidoreductase [Synechococcales cyanobacterium RM1_1_8]
MSLSSTENLSRPIAPPLSRPSAPDESTSVLVARASQGSPPIKLGLIGAGRWGSHLIRNFGAAARAEVVAIADPHGPSLERASSLLAESPRLLSDWRQLLAVPGLEAVVVATPAASHFEVIEAALRRGLHVLAEKPLTLSPGESQRLCELARRGDRQLMVDHTYLFHPAIAAGKQLIQAGALGQLRYGYSSRTHLGPIRQDVDVLWDLAIHDIAIFNHWLGQIPRQVQAQGQVWLQPQQRTPLSPQGLMDTVWAQLHYVLPQAGDSSALGVQMQFSWLNPDKQRRLVLVGDRAALIFDELAGDPLVLMAGHLLAPGQRIDPSISQTPGPNPGPNASQQWHPTGLERRVIPVPPQEPLQRMCEHFLDCIERNQASGISEGSVGRDLVAILAGLSDSLSRREPVLL